jgi:Spy/CpxP family protein refolding chaperone
VYYRGMGPGMMGGYGPGGYGPGGYAALGLTDEQRDKIAAIQEDAWKKRWGLMQAMHELGWKSFGSGTANEADARKAYEATADLRKQMFEANLDASKRVQAVLTKEQKERLSKERRPGW